MKMFRRAAHTVKERFGSTHMRPLLFVLGLFGVTSISGYDTLSPISLQTSAEVSDGELYSQKAYMCMDAAKKEADSAEVLFINCSGSF